MNANTNLHRMRAIASGADLAEALAPELPSTHEVLIPELVREGGAHPNQQVSPREQMQMMREWAAGVPVSEVEARYGVSRGYIRAAMQRRFGSREAMLAALQNLVTENAVGVQMIAQEKIHELSGAQAVFAGKLLVETMVTLDKHIQAQPKTVNFGAMKALGNTLKAIQKVVGPSDAPSQPS